MNGNSVLPGNNKIWMFIISILMNVLSLIVIITAQWLKCITNYNWKKKYEQNPMTKQHAYLAYLDIGMKANSVL